MLLSCIAVEVVQESAHQWRMPSAGWPTCAVPGFAPNRRALQRMSLQQVPPGEAEEAGAGEEEGQPAPQEGSHGSADAAQQAQQAQQQAVPGQPQLELQPAGGWGGRPNLARHSAPLPVLLHQLSTYPSVPLPAEGASLGEAGAGGAPPSAFAAARVDPAALAAAAAALAPAAGEAEEEGQRSITRLMGESCCLS